MNTLQEDYEVCLSFAGENRPYVQRVADALSAEGIRVFYDAYEKVELWGKDLYQHLDGIYRNRAKYCVVFISADYVQKLWCGHELKSAQARAFEEAHREYILPVRLDETEVAGILPTVGYVNGTTTLPEEVAHLIVEKLQRSSTERAPTSPPSVSPPQVRRLPNVLYDHPIVAAIRERLPEPFEACRRYHERVVDLVRAGKWVFNIGTAYPPELLRADEALSDALNSFARDLCSAAEEIDKKREEEVRRLGSSLVAIATGNRLSIVREALLTAARSVEGLKHLRGVMQKESDWSKIQETKHFHGVTRSLNRILSEIDAVQEQQDQAVALLNAYSKKK